MIRIALLIMVAVVMIVFFITGNGAPRGDIKPQKTQTSQSADTTRLGPNSQANTPVENKPPVKLSPDSLMATKENNYVRAAFKFLEDNKSHYKISDPRVEFIVEGELDDTNLHTVILDQVHDGVKVRYGYFSIHFGPDRPVSFNDVVGAYDPEAKKVNTKAAIGEEQAKNIVINDMDKVKVDWPENAKPEIKNAELSIARFDKELKLAWAISVTKGYSGWGYWIDAQTGKILESGSSAIR